MIMGASNLMMGLTLVLVICLAVVLTLVLVLLAELYCSALLRRRNHRHSSTTTTTTTEITTDPSQPVTNFYSQSILSAPRNILYPSLAGAGTGADEEKSPENQETKQDSIFRNGYLDDKDNEEDLVYISNPVFDDGENGRRSKAAGNTPFETPETSPSRLETEESSGTGSDEEGGEEEITSVKVAVETPPLTPMKKLPATVNDGGGGGGDLNSNNCDGGSCSSSSGTPCTSSLSW